MRIKIPSALRSKLHEHDRSSFHVTSLDFGRQIPSYICPFFKGDKISLACQQFFRMTPLVVPTFGSADLRTHAFFVPYRLLGNWNNWYVDTVDPSSPSELPYFTEKTVLSLLTTEPYAKTVAYTTNNSPSIEGNDDFNKADIIIYVPSSGNYFGYQLTERGRWIYHVLCGLGYSFNFTTKAVSGFGSNDKLDAMPLLAFARILYDVFYPSQYVQQGGFAQLFDGSTVNFITTQFNQIFQLIYLPYESDFYTSLWYDLNQVGATPSQNTQTFQDPSNPLSVSGGRDGVNVVQTASSQTETLSDTALHMLTTLADLMIRNNIVGGRFLDRVVARTGYTSKIQKAQSSYHLKSWTSPINIQDVTASTATASQMLGEQAGKGHMFGSSSLSFEPDEDGFLLCISYMVPHIGYVQGRKPWTIFKTSRSDYYTEEFDGTQMAPVRNDELFAQYDPRNVSDTDASQAAASYNEFVANGGSPSGVFGFAPIYHQYKHGFDFLTGDFVLKSRNVGRDSYHTFRLLEQPKLLSPLALDSSFLAVDGAQYDRIFTQDSTADSGARYDHFEGYFKFKVSCQNHALPLQDSFPLFNKSGKEIAINLNGNIN